MRAFQIQTVDFGYSDLSSRNAQNVSYQTSNKLICTRKKRELEGCSLNSEELLDVGPREIVDD